MIYSSSPQHIDRLSPSNFLVAFCKCLDVQDPNHPQAPRAKEKQQGASKYTA